MFNIGPLELLLIAVVALLVVGPERLPSAVRTTSLWVGRFRRNFYKIKADIERELNADEIKRQLYNESVLADLDDAKKQVTDFAKDTEKSVQASIDLDDEKKQLSAENSIAGDLKQTAEDVKEVNSKVKKFHQNIKKDLAWKNEDSSNSGSTDEPG